MFYLLSNKFAPRNGDERVMMLCIVSDAEATNAQLKKGKKQILKNFLLFLFS